METILNKDNIIEDVQRAISESQEIFENDEVYKRFSELYNEMKRLGLIEKQQYNIPLIDTIGRKHYEELKNSHNYYL